MPALDAGIHADRRVVTFTAGLASGQTRWPGHDGKGRRFRL